MTAKNLVKLSLRSIFRNRMRSLLTSLGIIIGVGSVIIMVAVGEGSQAQIQAQIQSMGTNLLMVVPERGRNAANRLNLQDSEKIRKESSYLQAVSGTTRKDVTVIGGSGDWSTTVSGVEPDYLVIKDWAVSLGDFFTEKDSAARKKVAVLGSTVAEDLFGTENPVGAHIRIDRVPFTVIGVLESKGSTGMGNDQDDTVLVPLGTALSRLSNGGHNGGHLNSIEMSAISEGLMDQAQNDVEQIMRDSHRLRDDQDNDFRIVNQAEIINTASSTSKTLTILLGAIAGVSLLVGGIGIMNIMLVSVTERTREIGIRMSVGARKGDILLQFLAEAIFLSLMGGLIGIAMALSFSYVLDHFLNIPAIVKPGIVFLAGGFAASVGVFFGYYPAKKASNLYPIDALRYE